MSENKVKQFLEKIQSNSDKKIKKQAFTDFQNYLSNFVLSSEDICFLFEGDKSLKGVCYLSGQQTSIGSFKNSSREILDIIYFLIFSSKFKDNFYKEFKQLDPDSFQLMKLGDHFEYYYGKNKENEFKDKYLVPLKLIKVISDERYLLKFQDYMKDVKGSTCDLITEKLKEFKKEEVKLEKEYENINKMIKNTVVMLNPEAKTWDEVLKIKKKLLTTEFLNNQTRKNNENIIIDEENEIRDELIKYFIDPLKKNGEKLNFNNFSHDEQRKLHTQFPTFDPVFFLEKFYSGVNLDQFSNNLINLDQNIHSINLEEETLIDKNIYKYLDCKKLLDNILERFKNENKAKLNAACDKLLKLQNRINDSLVPVKKSFLSILNSKNSKEIIQKFEKYFSMRDEIENFLKFSNFVDLADYLKKNQETALNISQSTYIYGEFYEYFTQTIENIKTLLTNIIQNSMVPTVIIRHFKTLLHFDIESETIDLLLLNIKMRICDRINKFLSFTENFELKNYTEFFNDEFNINILPDDYFSDIITQADSYVLGSEKHNEEENQIFSQSIESKKELVDCSEIIQSLFSEIKEFLFMLKVIEETIMMKLVNLKTKRELEFLTLIKEIFFTLFHKLGEFLFDSSTIFDDLQEKFVEKCRKIDEDYAESEKNSELFQFYKEGKEKCTVYNKRFNKNTLQNLSSLLIDILDLFEVYLPQEEILIVNELKNSMIEKNFLSFLNDKFSQNLKFIDEENTINFFETSLSIHNQSFFVFTKNFLRFFSKSYRNIIDFYISIVKKTNDLTLEHEMIISTFFFTLKHFLLKFYDFYLIEEEINGKELYKNNCLIIEILKNYSFLSTEIDFITKSIFKGKTIELKNFTDDLNNFMNKIISKFEDIYVKNCAKILFDTIFFNIDSKKVAGFYDLFNSFLVESKSFTDIRSHTIDLILSLIDSVKEFFEFKKEKTKFLLKLILAQLLDLIIDEVTLNKKTYLKNVNLTLQILIEIQVILLILSSYMDELNHSKRKKLFLLIYNIIAEARNLKNFSELNIDESLVFNAEEQKNKGNLISETLEKYKSFFKCFNETNSK